MGSARNVAVGTSGEARDSSALRHDPANLLVMIFHAACGHRGRNFPRVAGAACLVASRDRRPRVPGPARSSPAPARPVRSPPVLVLARCQPVECEFQRHPTRSWPHRAGYRGQAPPPARSDWAKPGTAAAAGLLVHMARRCCVLISPQVPAGRPQSCLAGPNRDPRYPVPACRARIRLGRRSRPRSAADPGVPRRHPCR